MGQVSSYENKTSLESGYRVNAIFQHTPRRDKQELTEQFIADVVGHVYLYNDYFPVHCWPCEKRDAMNE